MSVYGLLVPLRSRFPKTARFLHRVPVKWLLVIYMGAWFVIGFVVYMSAGLR